MRQDSLLESTWNDAAPPGAERFSHGPFLVARDGRIAPHDPAAPPALRFAWRGRDCQAEVGSDAVTLTACPARVPYTIEHREGREAVLSLIATLPAELPEGWRVTLTPDHRLRLEVACPGEATAVHLLSEMVRFALTLDPLLERLEAAGAR
jgi:hypothetical protein